MKQNDFQDKVQETISLGQICPIICFYVAHELKIFFMYLHYWKAEKNFTLWYVKIIWNSNFTLSNRFYWNKVTSIAYIVCIFLFVSLTASKLRGQSRHCRPARSKLFIICPFTEKKDSSYPTWLIPILALTQINSKWESKLFGQFRLLSILRLFNFGTLISAFIKLWKLSRTERIHWYHIGTDVIDHFDYDFL